MIFIIHSKKYGPHKVEIDDEDTEKVLQYSWSVNRNKKRNGKSSIQSVRTSKQKDGKRTWLKLHKLIVPDAAVIDHIDGNPLNNKKSNLRICSQSENTRNAKTRSDNKTGYKGVTYRKDTSRFRAKIRVDNKLKHLGYFSTAESAALAYNEAAIKYFKKFAKLNAV